MSASGAHNELIWDWTVDGYEVINKRAFHICFSRQMVSLSQMPSSATRYINRNCTHLGVHICIFSGERWGEGTWGSSAEGRTLNEVVWENSTRPARKYKRWQTRSFNLRVSLVRDQWPGFLSRSNLAWRAETWKNRSVLLSVLIAWINLFSLFPFFIT